MRTPKTTLWALLLVLGLAHSLPAQYLDESANYQWERKWIGGGGYFMGMAFSPVNPGLMYVRSDVCAPHMRDLTETDVWTFTGDSYPVTSDRSGSVGITAHPTNENIVFQIAGGYNRPDDGGVFRSTNKGQTWELVLTKRTNGNDENSKKLGEPLAIDAINPNIIYAGTQFDGFYRSESGGDVGSWSLISSVPIINKGTRCVVIDTSETIGSPARSKYVYAGVHNDSIYRSSDGGLTFSTMLNAPTNPLQMVMSTNRELIVGTEAGIWKYTSSNSWENISPSGEETTSFLCVDVNPNNPLQLVAALKKLLYRSQDGGATWTSVSLANGTIVDNTLGFDFIRDPFATPASVHFDPFSSDVYVCDAYSVYKTSDVWAAVTLWEQQYKNINNTITIDLESPPKGTSNGVLYSASPDIEGLRFNEGERAFYTKYSRLGPNATSIDFCEEYPDVIYLTKSKKWSPTYQAWVFRADNGIINNTSETFAPDNTYYKTYPFNTNYNSGFANPPTDGSVTAYNAGGAKIAVSATDPDVAIYFAGGAAEKTFYTKDGGDTWLETIGLPYDDFVRRDCGNGGSCSEYDFNMPIAADRVDGNIFYAYYDLTGEFFVSQDGGKTWSKRASAGLPIFGGITQRSPFRLETAPYVAGDVWISLGEAGLYHSSDTGKTFSQVSFFAGANQVDLGKNKPGQSNPSVYVFGRAASDDQWGVFRSDDLGASWILITNPAVPGAPYPRSMTADRQVYGRVYLALGTTGIRVGALSTTPSPDSPPLAATNVTATSTFSDRVSLTWTDNATNETKFRVFRKVGTGSFERIGMVGFNTTSYVDLGLTPSTTYQYFILAFHEDASTSSDTITVTTVSDANNPTINLVTLDQEASEVGADTATFQLYTSGAIEVDLYLQLTFKGLATNTEDYETIDAAVIIPAGDTLKTITLTPKVDNNPAEGTETVIVRVSPGPGYFTGAFSTDTLRILDNPAANKPSDVSVQPQSPTWISVSWKDNSVGEEGFEIARSTNSGGPYELIGTASSGFEEFDDTNIEPNTTYYYAVRAIGSNGSSDFSSEGTGTSLPVSVYPKNFEWNRAADWDGNTTVAGDTDSLGNLTWSYLFNPIDTDEGKDASNPWWEQPLEKLNNWGTDSWNDGSVTPRIYANEMNERRDVVSADTYEGIPLVRWTSPVNKAIWVKISGTLTTKFRGNTNASFDRTADAVIVLRDSTGNYTKLWEKRDFGFYGGDFVNPVNLELIVRSGDQIFVSIHQPNSKKYKYEVVLTDSLSFTYLLDEGESFDPPGSVNSASATTLDFETVQLNWGDVSGELGYRIERKITGGNYEEVSSVGENVTTYIDTELIPSTSYTYRIVAYTIGSEASPSPETAAITRPGRIMDNADGAANGVQIFGDWGYSNFSGNGEFYGTNFNNDNNDNKGGDYFRFTPDIPQTGDYIIWARWVAASYYANNVPIEAHHAAGVDTFYVNQTRDAGKWMVLDTIALNAGTSQYLDWETYGTTSSVVVDAVRFALYIGPNNAPVGVDDSCAVNEGDLLSINTLGVLENDSDQDNDSLVAVLVSDVTHGTLSLQAGGFFTYLPDPGFTGNDSFTYKAWDGSDDSNIATVYITINPVDTTNTFVLDRYDEAGENQNGVIHDISSSGVTLRSGRSTQAQKAIFIFRDVNIPAGATILQASVQFTSRGTNTGSSPLTTYLFLEDNLTPNAVLAGGVTTNVSSRTLLSDSVQWDIPVWTDNTRSTDQLTPDFSQLVQALVAQGGWSSENSDIALVIQGHDNKSDNWREIKTYKGGGNPELMITYTTGSSSSNLKRRLIAEEEASNTSFVVYPNPVSRTLFLRIPKDQALDNLQLTDQFGHTYILEKSAVKQGANGYQVDLSRAALKPGLYVLQASVEGVVWQRKIILRP